MSSLRIRGMWGIDNPMKVFKYIYQNNENNDFNFMAIINNEKYYSFSEVSALEALAQEVNNLLIKDVEIRVPDNPAVLKKAKLITFSC